MRPDISEFSYGFAVVDELINWRRMGLMAAPVFPSLYEEGQSGVGYDVKLDRPGVPLFLQFNLSHRMVRRYCKECRLSLLDVPFYRMKLRASKYSDQHDSLLALEGEGNEVYYAAPIFSKPSEFNAHYFGREVVARSVFIRPSSTGPLPDDDMHHVSFADASCGYLLSEPIVVKGPLGFEGLTEAMKGHLFRMKSPLGMILTDLAESVYRVASRKTIGRKGWEGVSFAEWLQGSHPLKQLAFLSRHFFECELLIVQRNDQNDGAAEGGAAASST